MVVGEAMASGALSAEDERAIIAVLTAYATAADEKDRALLETCFAEGATANYGALGNFESREAVIDGVMAWVNGCGTSLHFMSNFVVQADGEGAIARSYTQAVVNLPGLDAPARTAGIYDDRLVRERSAWRIIRRTYTSIG
jgi:hypothetical protein